MNVCEGCMWFDNCESGCDVCEYYYPIDEEERIEHFEETKRKMFYEEWLELAEELGEE